ncbi:MAG: hypothetical protein JWL62_849 [Hyphomicrobiales bacterium]|nr:hypothetical protein [Hyphomicrobiales bacterium]
MARLRVEDRRTLLGDNFAELEAQFEIESRAAITPEEKRKELDRAILKNGESRFSAVALILGSAFFVWASYYRDNDVVDLTTSIGIVALILGFVWYAWLVSSGRKLAKRKASREFVV